MTPRAVTLGVYANLIRTEHVLLGVWKQVHNLYRQGSDGDVKKQRWGIPNSKQTGEISNSPFGL